MMATKNNPGQFDCYTKAGPDEPLFTLRAKDPAAPFLVDIWVASRTGDLDSIMRHVEKMSRDPGVIKRVSEDGYEKLTEATACAREMRRWHRENARD